MPSSTFCDSFDFFGRPCVFCDFAAVHEQSSNLFRRKSGTMRRGRTEDWGCGGRTPSALTICFGRTLFWRFLGRGKPCGSIPPFEPQTFYHNRMVRSGPLPLLESFVAHPSSVRTAIAEPTSAKREERLVREAEVDRFSRKYYLFTGYTLIFMKNIS